MTLNKKRLNEYQELIRNDEYSKEANDYMHHQLIINPLIRFLLIFVLLLFTALNYKKVEKLAKITFDSFFNHEDIFGIELYIVFLAATCLFLALFALIMFLINAKTNEHANHLKALVKTYKIYDMVTFILSSIVFLFFIIMFIVTPCTVDGPSMKNTLNSGDRVMVWHLNYKPKRDDIIIFDASNKEYGDNYSGFFVKRIVAVPGDKVKYDNTTDTLYVNDIFVERNVGILEYKILTDSVDLDYTALEFVVPSDRFMVFGDNRPNSTDSRMIGLIYRDDILGSVGFRFYPFNKIGKINKDIIHY